MKKSVALFALLQVFAVADALALDAGGAAPAARAYYGSALDGSTGGSGEVDGQGRDAGLKDRLYEILRDSHVLKDGSTVRLVADCRAESLAEGETCVERKELSYARAREKLFGQLYLSRDAGGKYRVWDVYCQRFLTQDDVANVGPGKIPEHTVINAEHTWPQSRFNANERAGTQKTDLHHLFPTDSKMNQVRSNYEFGEIDEAKGRKQSCDGNWLGAPVVPAGYSLAGNQRWYEVPDQHKGNVARALFYFAVRYRAAMSPLEEHYMRAWHKLDPVDAEDILRNEEIYEIQGNRNPFIDFPELVDRIPDFDSTSYRLGRGDEGAATDGSGGRRSDQARQDPSQERRSSVAKAGVTLEDRVLTVLDGEGQVLARLDGIVAVCAHDEFGTPGAPFSSYDLFAVDADGTLHKIRSARKEVKAEPARAATLEKAMEARGLPCTPVPVVNGRDRNARD